MTVSGAPRFKYDERTGRYRGEGGRFLSRTDVRGALDNAIAAADNRVREVTRSLQEGRVGIQEWKMAMREDVKNIQLYSAAAAKGGWAQMSPSDWGRLGTEVREQYGFLERWASQIQSGEAPLDGRMLSRAELYTEAGRKTFHLTEERDAEARGLTEYRNILNPADHCDECLEITAQGWQLIGSLPDIGDRQCRARCKCEWEYR